MYTCTYKGAHRIYSTVERWEADLCHCVICIPRTPVVFCGARHKCRRFQFTANPNSKTPEKHSFKRAISDTIDPVKSEAIPPDGAVSGACSVKKRRAGVLELRHCLLACKLQPSTK